MQTASTEGTFVVERVNAKIGALERRAEHLQRRIKDHPPADRGRSFDITELQAIEAAIAALRVHRSLLDPATSPTLALSELLNAISEVEKSSGIHPLTRRLEAAIEQGQKVLRDIRED